MTNAHDHLLGRWLGEGSGEYPTIEPFAYREILEVVQVPGRPMATWRSTTTDAVTGEARHTEVGFLRSTSDACELVLAHGFGVTEISVARPATPGSYDFGSTSISCSPSAKRVDQVRRTVRVVGDVLEYEISMAAVGLEMTHHLSARLTRS